MILIDAAEPEDLEKLLSQTAVTVRSQLNKQGKSDYFFGSASGHTLQFGRVQAGELLSDIDSMEDELRRYYNSADENYQIIEGIISPVPLATITDRQYYAVKSGSLTWNKLPFSVKMSSPLTPSSRPMPKALSFSYKVEYITDSTGIEFGVLNHERVHNVPTSLVYVWIHRLAEAGIPTYCTVNWIETARLLGVIYKNEQKPPEEHTTLQRVIRPRLQIKEQDPFVRSLVFLSAAMKLNIGEKTAQLIADKYANIGDLFLTSVDELTEIEGIGKITAERVLKSLGREI
jgi:hypothetical protein